MAEGSSESMNIERRMKVKLSSSNESFEGSKNNKFIERIKTIYEGWLYIRAKVEEIMEPVLFFGGGALTALIALGILPWGALGIGICATLTFIGISRFVLTNSWTWWHNQWAAGKKENDEENLDNENYNQINEQKDEEDEEQNYKGNENENEEDAYKEKEEEKQGTGFVKGPCEVFNIIKLFSIPSALATTGVIFGIFGAVGTLGLGLALGIAIPSLILGVTTLVGVFRKTKLLFCNADKQSDNFWGVSMLVAGLLSVATFAVLGLTGVLALPTAIALGAPGLALAGIMALIFVGTCIGFWVKNREKEADEEKEPCIFIGLSFNPEWLVSKKEEVENKIIKEDSDVQYRSGNPEYPQYD